MAINSNPKIISVGDKIFYNVCDELQPSGLDLN